MLRIALIKILTVVSVIILAAAAPWWFSVIAAVLTLFLTQILWAPVVVGIMLDLIYSPRGEWLAGVKFTFIMLLITAAVIYLRKRLIFYSPRA